MTTTDAVSGTSARPAWHAWTAAVLLALTLFLMASDFTVMFMAVPAVTEALTPTTTQVLWIMHVGEFVAAGLVITMGWLTARIGPSRLLMAAMALYLGSSALAAFAPDAAVLLGARVLIGAAAAAASPAAISLLRSMFTSTKHFSIAFAAVMGAFPAGSALGPPMGGLLLEHFWWGSVFLINVPVAALVLAVGLWVFPRTRGSTTGRIDTVSVAVSMSGVMLVVFGLQEIADRGFALPYFLSALAGVALGVWFILRQRRVDNPLLDLRLFAVPALRVAAAAFVLAAIAFVAVDFVLVQYLQIVVGVPTGRLGLMLAAPGVAAILGAALAPVLARRIAPGPLISAGLGISLLGVFAIIAALPAGEDLIAVIIAGTTLVSLGIAPLMLLGAQLIVTSVPPERAGSAVAVQDISAGMGGAVGMAFIGSISMSVYGRMLGATAPAGVSDAGIGAAEQSPGGAVSVAEGLGGLDGQRLLAAAQDALTWGAVAAYAAAAVVGIGAILLTLRGLRGMALPGLGGEDGGGPDPEAASVPGSGDGQDPDPQQPR